MLIGNFRGASRFVSVAIWPNDDNVGNICSSVVTFQLSKSGEQALVYLATYAGILAHEPACSPDISSNSSDDQSSSSETSKAALHSSSTSDWPAPSRSQDKRFHRPAADIENSIANRKIFSSERAVRQKRLLNKEMCLFCPAQPNQK